MSKKKESAEEAYAYTPGLKVKKGVAITKTRLLPIPGTVLVEKGNTVDFDTIVAKTDIPGKPTFVKLTDILNMEPADIPSFMVKKVGDSVEKGDILVKYTPFFGLIKKFAKAPTKGVIEAYSDVTGQLVLREPSTTVEVKAYIPGKVVDILPRMGVLIETDAAFIQGIFGIGGERHGALSVVVESPEEILTVEKIRPEHKGKILVGGSLATLEAFRRAVELGVNGIIVGGIRGVDLTSYLGYEIGVAITGQEDINITLIATEGFGEMSMSMRTFNLLKEYEGYETAINGATQIRAGVIRPEIIIPHKKSTSGSDKEELARGMRPGTPVRIIREPYFGKIGTVVSLPIQLQKVETESPVRVLEVKLEKETVIVPRANVEIIEE
jgi:hypothetical protein